MRKEAQCLVIGSGIAGLSAALAAADNGAKVIVATCAPDAVDSNTWRAQGGIIYEGSKASSDTLVEDILEAGCRINY